MTDFYEDDFNSSQLQAQLLQLTVNFSHTEVTTRTVTFGDICDYLRLLGTAQQAIYSQVVILAKLILVIPATNASSERSFSALRHIKSYLTLRQRGCFTPIVIVCYTTEY